MWKIYFLLYWKILLTVFCRIWSSIHHQYCMRIPFSPHLPTPTFILFLEYSLFSQMWRWYLILVLICTLLISDNEYVFMCLGICISLLDSYVYLFFGSNHLWIPICLFYPIFAMLFIFLLFSYRTIY